MVEAEDRVMKRVTGETVSAFYDACIAGAASICGSARGLRRSRATAARPASRSPSGERIAADLVLVATGARANDDLAAAAGLACEDGILVDDFARRRARRLCDRRLRALLHRIATAARSARMRAERHRSGQGRGVRNHGQTQCATIRCRGSGRISTR